MSASALRLNDPLLPPPPGGFGTGATLALAAHVLLVAALAASVQWRASTPEVFAAELWSAMPQQAAPRAEEAPPPPAPKPAEKALEKAAEPAAVTPPPDAQIAIERERRERLQRDRLLRELEQRERLARAEAERREKERREKAEQRAAEARAQQELERRRAENLKRILGQAGGTGPATSSGTAAADAAPSRSYAGRLVAAIKPNIVFTEQLSGNPAAEVEVRLAAGGTVLSRRLLKTSGVKEWDDAVLRAIDRTGSLPRDVDGRVPPVLVIAFRPND